MVIILQKTFVTFSFWVNQLEHKHGLSKLHLSGLGLGLGLGLGFGFGLGLESLCCCFLERFTLLSHCGSLHFSGHFIIMKIIFL
jgi:hypothetical protein